MNCIKCKSTEIEEIGKSNYFIIFLGTGSLFLFFGFFIWPLLFIAIPILFASPFSLLLPKVYKCHSCKKAFTKKQIKGVK